MFAYRLRRTCHPAPGNDRNDMVLPSRTGCIGGSAHTALSHRGYKARSGHADDNMLHYIFSRLNRDTCSRTMLGLVRAAPQFPHAAPGPGTQRSSDRPLPERLPDRAAQPVTGAIRPPSGFDPQCRTRHPDGGGTGPQSSHGATRPFPGRHRRRARAFDSRSVPKVQTRMVG